MPRVMNTVTGSVAGHSRLFQSRSKVNQDIGQNLKKCGIYERKLSLILYNILETVIQVSRMDFPNCYQNR